MTWRRLEAEAPELARLAHDRLTAWGVAMIATIRLDGSPRIDPIEPVFAGGELLLGVSARSAKAGALRRDPRCALHAPVSGPDAGDPDVKLFGRVEQSRIRAGWWRDRAEEADVYRLTIEEAVAIEWDLVASVMRVRTWTAGGRERLVERAYP
jgi:hypothetical protein